MLYVMRERESIYDERECVKENVEKDEDVKIRHTHTRRFIKKRRKGENVIKI